MRKKSTHVVVVRPPPPPVAALVVWVPSLIAGVKKIFHLSRRTCCLARRGPLMEGLSPHRQPSPTTTPTTTPFSFFVRFYSRQIGSLSRFVHLD